MREMCLKEFYETGFIQELNRLFLHGYDLALAMTFDSDGNPVTLGPIYDYRAEPTGIEFDPDSLDRKKRLMVVKAYEVAEAKKNSNRVLPGMEPDLAIELQIQSLASKLVQLRERYPKLELASKVSLNSLLLSMEVAVGEVLLETIKKPSKV